MSSLLSHECSVYGLHIKPSTIAHPRAEMGCFVNQEFTDRNVVWYFYGTLVNQFMGDVLNSCGVHGEGVILVTNDLSHTSVIGLT